MQNFQNSLIKNLQTLYNKVRNIFVKRYITAQEFDQKFDNGEEISDYLDFSKSIKLNNLKKTEFNYLKRVL